MWIVERDVGVFSAIHIRNGKCQTIGNKDSKNQPIGDKDKTSFRMWIVDCATKRRITKRRITKRRKNKTSNYITPITKRRMLQKVKLQNLESYKRWKNKRSKVTKYFKKPKKVENCGTVYRKNPLGLD
jgi:hypothetical protein